MKTIQSGLLLIAAQMEIVDSAKAEIERLRNQIIEKFSPVKVGDIVKVNGYSHQGKRMRIDHIQFYQSYFRKNDGEFRATGKVIKKDGTPGAATAEWREPTKVKGGA